MEDQVEEDPKTRSIIAAAIEVHRILGPGLLESVYEEALCREFELRGIEYDRQKDVTITYKGHPIKGQRLDLLVHGEIVVEVKSTRANDAHFLAQLLSYLKGTGLKTGLIINFGLSRLVDGIQRVRL